MDFVYDPKRKDLSIHVNQNFIYTRTHIGSLLSKDFYLQASLFLNECWRKRKENGYWNSIIANMDETPIFFNMTSNKTIAKKGTKSILIKSQNQEKCRLTVVLCVTADGYSFTSVINI